MTRETRIVVLTRAGRAFCAAGDYDWIEIQSYKGFYSHPRLRRNHDRSDGCEF